MASREVKRVIGELEQFVETSAKTVTLELQANLKETTPKRTGYTAATWRVKTGSGAPERPRRRESPGDVQIARAKQARSESALRRYRLEDGPIRVVSETPYTGRLDQGFSIQRGAGWIERSINRSLKDADNRLSRRRRKSP